jgi:hypothetical protein
MRSGTRTPLQYISHVQYLDTLVALTFEGHYRNDAFSCDRTVCVYDIGHSTGSTSDDAYTHCETLSDLFWIYPPEISLPITRPTTGTAQ